MPPTAPYDPQNPFASPYYGPHYAEQKSKVAAALFAFFLGGLGAHGFYLGNYRMGVTYLVLSVVCFPLTFFLIGLLWWVIMPIMVLIQAILYISASDQDFYRKYVLEQRWF